MRFNESYGSLSLPVYCTRQKLTPAPGSTIVGRFADDTPGAIERRLGTGRILLIGASPGLAYLQPSQVGRSGLPETFPEGVRKLITEPAEAAHVQRHVRVSDYQVEGTLQEGGQGAVVTLVNFRNQPVSEVKVTLVGLPNAAKVTSLRHGSLEIARTAEGPQVSLPIDYGDFLVVE